MAEMVEVLRCPNHGMTDCSPLLNGCSVVARLGAAYGQGWEDATRTTGEAIKRVEALCARWDEVTKGESPTTRTIRAALYADGKGRR